MSNFEQWITEKLNRPIRIIDLARELGEQHGELVRKWYRGEAYPSKTNIIRLAKYLKMNEKELKKELLLIRIKDLES